jgi:hypothetical protein
MREGWQFASKIHLLLHRSKTPEDAIMAMLHAASFLGLRHMVRSLPTTLLCSCGGRAAPRLMISHIMRTLGPLNIRALEIFLGYASPCLTDLFTPKIGRRCLNTCCSYGIQVSASQSLLEHPGQAWHLLILAHWLLGCASTSWTDLWTHTI